jgi:hypothetical protein
VTAVLGVFLALVMVAADGLWWWRSIVEWRKTRAARAKAEREADQLAAHLHAFGGESQVVLAVLGRAAPAPLRALEAAEETYLERSGWVRDTSGRWFPRWDLSRAWSLAKALEHQRRRDAFPVERLRIPAARAEA